jgi:hypothetical protein
LFLANSPIQAGKAVGLVFAWHLREWDEPVARLRRLDKTLSTTNRGNVRDRLLIDVM